MSLSIRQIHPVFVSEVSGVDLTRPLSPGEAAAVEAGMDRHAVLVFHDQQITDEQQMAFSRNFGALEDARRPAVRDSIGGDKRNQFERWPRSHRAQDGVARWNVSWRRSMARGNWLHAAALRRSPAGDADTRAFDDLFRFDH